MEIIMKTSSFAWILSACLVISIGLCGCSTVPQVPVQVDPTKMPLILTETTLPLQLPEYTQTATIQPTLTATLFVPKGTIKIVSQEDASVFGINLKQGVDLAVNQLSANLNNLGYQIEYVSYDDQSEIDIAVANAKEIIADPEALCGIGPLYSFIYLQTEEFYHRAGIPFISPSATMTEVTKRGYKEVNRILGKSDGQGVAAARFAQDQGKKKIFVLGGNDKASLEIISSFNKEAKKLGLKVVDTVYTDKTEGFEDELVKLKESESDMIFSPSSSGQAGIFFREARAVGFEGILLGTDNLDTSDLVNIAGPFVIDGGGLYYINSAIRPDLYPDAIQFIEDYKLNYADTPGFFSVQAYDAAGFCLKAIEIAIQSKNGGLPTRDEVTQAIHSMTDYKGISGTFTFTEKGDLTEADYHIMNVVSSDPANWNQNTLVATYKVAPSK
jgi:branched-chain amino acid transport system substrate-binding protein